MDNLLQVFSAPVFVMIELFDLVGIRTKEVEMWKEEIRKNVEEFHKAKAAWSASLGWTIFPCQNRTILSFTWTWMLHAGYG